MLQITNLCEHSSGSYGWEKTWFIMYWEFLKYSPIEFLDEHPIEVFTWSIISNDIVILTFFVHSQCQTYFTMSVFKFSALKRCMKYFLSLKSQRVNGGLNSCKFINVYFENLCWLAISHVLCMAWIASMRRGYISWTDACFGIY